MKRLNDFLKLRKQNDCVKIALFLFLAAVYFIFNGTVQVVEYARNSDKPVEYVLTAYSASASLGMGLDKICELDGAVGASFQREYMITSETGFLQVTELSEQYLSECYDIQVSGNGKKIWLNDAAFTEFVGTTEEVVVRITYALGETVENAEFIRCASLSGDVPYAVSVGSSITLTESENIRVMFEGVDITGNTVTRLTKLGYGIANESAIIAETYERKAVMMKVKYSLIAAAFAVIGGYGFIRNVRRNEMFVSNSCTCMS